MNRLLLDTHTFLWWDSKPEKHSTRVLALCQDPAVILYLSLVSLWEIQIKSSLGKLPLALPLREIVRIQQEQSDLRLLPITSAHIFALEALPLHHNDPFDRLLIAQAISEGLSLASIDSHFSAYPASVIW
jgi:PIN domain nuclease of toxin-antitoxin system